MQITANYGLKKPEDNENFDQQAHANWNMDKIDQGLVPYGGTTTNVGNDYIIAAPTIIALSVGMAVSIKINTDSTGAATLNWDGKGAKAIKKTNGSDVTNLKANGIYTLRYDGTNFILQGEGASGDAAASDLLLGKKATTDAGEITGTMPNKVGSVTVITPGSIDQVIPQGYYGGAEGDGKVLGDFDLVSANIKAGVNIFGVAGNSNVVDTSAGDAAAAEVITGKKAYVDGALVTGTMINNGAVTITPGTTDQTINAGYHNGSGKVVGDADLIASNIKSGVNIFGVAGSCAARRYATGQTTNTSGTQSLTVTGLIFTPSLVLVHGAFSQSWTSYGNFSVYSSTANMTYSLASSVYNASSNTSASCTVSSTGFTITVFTPNQLAWDWIAIE